MMGRARVTPRTGIYAKVINGTDKIIGIPLIGHSTRVGQRTLLSPGECSVSYPVSKEGSVRLFMEADAVPERTVDGDTLLRWVYKG